MKARMKNLIVVLDDGKTYGGIEGAFTMGVPDDLEGEGYEGYITEHAWQGEPVVPMSELLDSVVLAMQGLGLGHHADDVQATVEDFVVNNFGEL